MEEKKVEIGRVVFNPHWSVYIDGDTGEVIYASVYVSADTLNAHPTPDNTHYNK